MPQETSKRPPGHTNRRRAMAKQKNRGKNVGKSGYKKLNPDSVEALLVHKKKVSPAAEAKLFETKKAALEQHRHRFTRAVYSVISQYHQAYIDWYPEHPKSYERQGYAEFYQHNYKRAIERLGQAIYLGANSGKVWRTLGRCCYDLWKKDHDWGLLWDAKASYEVQSYRYHEARAMPYIMILPILIMNASIAVECAQIPRNIDQSVRVARVCAGLGSRGRIRVRAKACPNHFICTSEQI
jgi:hypothetical protein